MSSNVATALNSLGLGNATAATTNALSTMAATMTAGMTTALGLAPTGSPPTGTAAMTSLTASAGQEKRRVRTNLLT